MNGHDPDDRGDDADGTTDDHEDRPDGWPDDWTTADDDARSPRDEPVSGEPSSDPASDDDATAAPGADDPAPDDPAPNDDATAEPTANDDATEEPPANDDATAEPTANDGERTSSRERREQPVESSDTNPDRTDPADGRDSNPEQTDSTLGKRSTPEKPPAPGVDDDPPTIADDGLLTWFLNSRNGSVVFVRDIVSSVAAVAAIGLVLFAISGIWPPLVAVESGSMEPHMSKGDLVFIVDEQRYAPQSAVQDTGVSTHTSAQAANGYSKFGNYGDVVVYRPYGERGRTPIIHRARFYVEKGENWVQEANPDYMAGVDSCAEVPRDMCPAPYDGFITKGDANGKYDQVGSQSDIVKPKWVRGKAQVRVPLLGWIRLEFAKLTATTSPVAPFLPASGSALFARLGALGAAAGAAVVATRT
ncbi:S26 family signal peptidase [Halorubellus sp. PRR65]|uniref:S26 family signal peptidase n=1 Tax=Halorubellus sp. PRR65 TaxID=3098148 RepID=UPI002B262489|nr:S26 family signal peptidase [Halorubellus sp. PRR65]